MECLRLPVQDIDFAANQIIVRDGKGNKDRVTMLPVVMKQPLRQQLAGVRKIYEGDLADGDGQVQMPYALSRKYPNAAGEWRWQWVFRQLLEDGYDIRTVQELLGHSPREIQVNIV